MAAPVEGCGTSDAFSDGFRFGGEEFPVTASIGIACTPDDGDRPQALIQNADAAMYDSKRRMRNSFQRFTPALVQSQQEKLKLEAQLRRAAENNEFHLVYQPQVDLRHGRIVAAEALIRWRNQQLGEMRPDRFIGHAENTGDGPFDMRADRRHCRVDVQDATSWHQNLQET